MCGRFALFAPSSSIAEVFGVALPDLPELVPRYNIAPTTGVLGVRRDGTARVAATFRWGLVPRWAPDLKGGARMINARAETARTKPAFRDAFARRRLLIPASGFFEWRTEGKQKWPHFFSAADGAPLAFAGLWETWSKGDAPVHTATILTTSASAVVAPLHDRMPVILALADFDAWLDPTTPLDEAEALLRPADHLVARPVSQDVNSVRNDGPHLVEPAIG